MDHLPEPPDDNIQEHLVLGHNYVRRAVEGIAIAKLREIHAENHTKLGRFAAHTHGRDPLLAQQNKLSWVEAPTEKTVIEHVLTAHKYTPVYVEGADRAVLLEEHDRDHAGAGVWVDHTHQAGRIIYPAPPTRGLPRQAPDDEMQNNILVAGGILMALMNMPGVGKVEVVMEDGDATNQILVHPPWMKSPYRITVERIPAEIDPDYRAEIEDAAL